MTHELAKELEVAGFPFIEGLQGYRRPPTLSELIEACIERGQFSLNYRGPGQWITQIGYYIEPTTEQKILGQQPMAQHFQVEASTPEEAVARLWLALNPSPVEKK